MSTSFRSVLVIDDDAINLQLLHIMLTHANYQVQTLSDPTQTLAFLNQNQIDLILLDIQMPNLNGIDLCRQIKSDSMFADIPIIFVTAQQDEATLVQAFEAGAVDYLTKPYRRTEILARVRTQLALRQSEYQLKNKLSFCELMMTMLAHDLRGPISSASDYIQHLMVTPYSQIELLTRMQILGESIQSTHHFLEQTLQWACCIQEEVAFRPVWSELSVLFKDSLQQYHLKALEKDIELKADVPERLFAFVDPDMVRTILLNLIHNAMKFTSSQGSVSLSCQFDVSEISLNVSDTGTGMTAEQVSQLLQKSSMQSKTGTSGEKGTGLGLKICHQLAAKHGGHLEIKSLPGEGSVFRVVLPGAARFQPD